MKMHDGFDWDTLGVGGDCALESRLDDCALRAELGVGPWAEPRERLICEYLLA